MISDGKRGNRKDPNYFLLADDPPGISVSLQVENKQFIGDGHLIGSSLSEPHTSSP
jgi:hypothetical protein